MLVLSIIVMSVYACTDARDEKGIQGGYVLRHAGIKVNLHFFILNIHQGIYIISFNKNFQSSFVRSLYSNLHVFTSWISFVLDRK